MRVKNPPVPGQMIGDKHKTVAEQIIKVMYKLIGIVSRRRGRILSARPGPETEPCGGFTKSKETVQFFVLKVRFSTMYYHLSADVIRSRKRATKENTL